MTADDAMDMPLEVSTLVDELRRKITVDADAGETFNVLVKQTSTGQPY